ncbi:MAG: hypothetical protein NUW22_05130 [Acidobacteria bacterium]|nr:hypothetical protein [Acidobacteriota bacterium]
MAITAQIAPAPTLPCAPEFVLINDDGRFYEDYEHYPQGFHNNDRIERVTRNAEPLYWYATVTDRDDNGNDYFHHESGECRTPEEAVAWVLARRAEGPKNRPEQEAVCR